MDRDGVIIRERGDYNYKQAHVEIVEGAVEALRKLKEKGFIFIVVTNQGGIAKGIYRKKAVEEIHQCIKEFFEVYQIHFKAFYFCPHHDAIENCLCRKPNSLMIEKALAKYRIDASKSFLIGDSERDIIAGERAGLRGVKVNANDNLMDYLHFFEN